MNTIDSLNKIKKLSLNIYEQAQILKIASVQNIKHIAENLKEISDDIDIEVELLKNISQELNIYEEE